MTNYYNQMLQDWDLIQQAIQGTLTTPGSEPSFNLPGYQFFTMPGSAFFELIPNKRGISGDWKFHLSIAPENLPEAWDIVIDEMLKDGDFHHGKVVKPEKAEKFSEEDYIQCGKHITIYTRNDIDPSVYQDLLSRIEHRLIEARVRPGPESYADRPVPGSGYASYRRETTPDGQYIASASVEHLDRSERHNPFNSPDPYIDFSVTVSPASPAM